MKDQLIETWLINNRVNLLLLDAINDSVCCSAFRGEMDTSPCMKFRLMHNVRYWRLDKIGREFIEGQRLFEKDKEYSRDMIRYQLIKSSEAVAKILECGYKKMGELKGYPRGVFTFFGYLISYESHLRGQIILTLNQSGYSLPQSVHYGMWNWNKI